MEIRQNLKLRHTLWTEGAVYSELEQSQMFGVVVQAIQVATKHKRVMNLLKSLSRCDQEPMRYCASHNLPKLINELASTVKEIFAFATQWTCYAWDPRLVEVHADLLEH